GWFLLRPDGLHGLNSIAQQPVTRAVDGAVVPHLFRVPTRPDAEHETSAGQVVEAGPLLRRGAGIPTANEADAGAYLERLRRHRGRRECDERVVGIPVLL